MERGKIAVVGSGISGLSAAWLLQRAGHDVTLFEKEATCGGHTLTDTSGPAPVDLGFQVFNLTSYPNLVGMFEALGVATEPSDMSFALSTDGGRLEWGSGGLGALFAQRSNLLSPSFWRMLLDVVAFGRAAPEVLDPRHAATFADMTTGSYLRRGRYSQQFIRHYFLPMCAAVWSVPESQMMATRVVTLIRFWVNHHLLDLTQRPVWRVVSGRSRTYVRAICSELRDVRCGCPVAGVTPAATPGAPVVVHLQDGASEQFGAVVLATHSDVSLALLGSACLPVAPRRTPAQTS